MAYRWSPNTWTPLAVDFFTHPKVCSLSASGKLLYLASLCYAQRHLTDGAIPAGALPMLAAEAGASRSQSTSLVAVGLWDEASDGWTIHDWGEWNQPAETIEERREQDRARKKAWRDAKAAKKNGGRDASRDADADGDATRQSRSTPTPTPTPPLTPPVGRDAPGETAEEEQPPPEPSASPDPDVEQLLAATWAHMARQLTDDATAAGEAQPRNRAAYERTVAANLAATHDADARRTLADSTRPLAPWELAERLDPRCGPDDGGAARAAAAAEQTSALIAEAANHTPSITNEQREANQQLRRQLRARRQHQETTP